MVHPVPRATNSTALVTAAGVSAAGVSAAGVIGAGVIGAGGGATAARVLDRSAVSVLHLQRTAGNHAVAAVMRSGPVQRSKESDAKLAGLHTQAQGYSTHAQAVLGALSQTMSDGLIAVDGAKTGMLSVCDSYDKVFDVVNGVLAAAGEEFKATDAMLDAAIGVLIGASMGLGIGEIAEAVNVVRTGVKVAVEIGGEVGEAIAGKGTSLATGGARDKRDAALKIDDKLSPTAKRMEAFQTLSGHYRALAEVSTGVGTLADIGHWCDVLVGDIKVSESGGTPTRTPEELQAATTALGRIDQQLRVVEQSLARLRASFTKVKADADAAVAKSEDARVAEQDLWLEYIAGLAPTPEASVPRDHFGVDGDYASKPEADTAKGPDVRYKILDKIEAHLEEIGVLSTGGKAGGRLTADFGSWWTSKADTDHAGAEAEAQVKMRYFDAMGPLQVGKVGAVTFVEGETCMVRVEGTRFNWSARNPNLTPIPERESEPDSLRQTHTIPGSMLKLDSWDAGARRFSTSIAG